ncbi:MAG: PLP-dependent aminotransferase family protein, partial [Chloroflexota bacterium]|nr:PLP-dependent aminotransferase family protein [Chloroflexota bacterium]
LELCPPLVAARVAAAARQRGVVVATLDGCYEGPPDRQGLLLGYGGLTRDEIARGAAVLSDVVRQEARRVPSGR